MELISKYSGLFAILVYGIILAIILLINKNKKPKEEEIQEVKQNRTYQRLDTDDEDALVASLVASIDYQNETNKNIEVLSVRRISWKYIK